MKFATPLLNEQLNLDLNNPKTAFLQEFKESIENAIRLKKIDSIQRQRFLIPRTFPQLAALTDFLTVVRQGHAQECRSHLFYSHRLADLGAELSLTSGRVA